jgi:hypothetical protein
MTPVFCSRPLAGGRNRQYKDGLASAKAKLADDPGAVAKLERQLKAARTRIQTLSRSSLVLEERPARTPSLSPSATGASFRRSLCRARQKRRRAAEDRSGMRTNGRGRCSATSILKLELGRIIRRG